MPPASPDAEDGRLAVQAVLEPLRAETDRVDRELAEFPPGKPVHLTDVSCGNAAIGDIATTKQTPTSHGHLIATPGI